MSSTNTKALLSRLGPFFGLLLLIIVITCLLYTSDAADELTRVASN